MGNMTFRPLRADEVDVRVSQCKPNGVSLLLYKDARCDMNILDETVGPERWQRHHSRDNANCTVAIYIPHMDQWVEKEDTGTESNTEAEKGLASDSFKRACFNWGIGRELYTAPFIWVPADGCTIKQDGQKSKCFDRFRVSDMTVEAGKITSITIVNDSRKGTVVYRFGSQEPRREITEQQAQEPAPRAQKPATRLTEASAARLREAAAQININLPELLRRYHVNEVEELSAAQYTAIMKQIQAHMDKQEGKE